MSFEAPKEDKLFGMNKLDNIGQEQEITKSTFYLKRISVIKNNSREKTLP
jgi:hypothetical protein